MIVVGGWDDALAAEVDKCIDKKVPTVVTDGDLAMSKRLTYLGTNWYNLGYHHGQYQCRYHKEAGPHDRQARHDLLPRRDQLPLGPPGPARRAGQAECPGVKVVADEESGTNVEQVAANTAAIIQGNPDLTGMVGFDSEAGPGIVRAVDESGQAGKIIVTSQRGRPGVHELDQGRHGQDDQHGEVRDDGLLRRPRISTPSTTTSSGTSAWTSGSRTRCRPSGTRA